MKNLVVVLLLIVAGLSGFGIYRGWFTMDQQKIEQDEIAAKAELRDLEQKVKEKASDLKGPVKSQK
jgi:hypothetical protein